jgi:DNA ligase-1
MARREFLALAKTFKMGKDDPSGKYISDKLDGTRAYWDGGITRGIPTILVPWANIFDPKKPGELKKKIKPVATGLWSRYGNPIIAPDWWLNQLPGMFLDGELFAGVGNFQRLRSIVAKDVPIDEEWREVEFAAFGAPSPESVFAAGEIKNPNFHRTIDPVAIMRFVKASAVKGVLQEFVPTPQSEYTFERELDVLQKALCTGGSLCYLHRHTLLSHDRVMAESQMEAHMDRVLDAGGEGIILRDPKAIWTPKRAPSIMKHKPYTDDQGTITGFVSGRETTKGSKLRGLIGAVILDYKGHRLEMSGFTDEERRFSSEREAAYAWDNPGVDMPDQFEGAQFKVGDTLEFLYRELSDDGIPKEGRYKRGV